MPEIIRSIETNHGRIEKADFIRFGFGAHHFVEIEECDGRVNTRMQPAASRRTFTATVLRATLQLATTNCYNAPVRTS